MFECLKWAGNPSGSLPTRASRSVVVSTAHKLTRLGAPSISRTSHSYLLSECIRFRYKTAAVPLKCVPTFTRALLRILGAFVPGPDACQSAAARGSCCTVRYVVFCHVAVDKLYTIQVTFPCYRYCSIAGAAIGIFVAGGAHHSWTGSRRSTLQPGYLPRVLCSSAHLHIQLRAHIRGTAVMAACSAAGTACAAATHCVRLRTVVPCLVRTIRRMGGYGHRGRSRGFPNSTGSRCWCWARGWCPCPDLRGISHAVGSQRCSEGPDKRRREASSYACLLVCAARSFRTFRRCCGWADSSGKQWSRFQKGT